MDFKTDGAPLTEELLSEARGALGKLQWLSSQTRPDLSISANSLSSDLGNASRASLLEINKAIRKAKSTSFNLEYAPLADFDRLVVYADASFQNLSDGGSQGGYIIFATNSQFSPIHPISWASRRIQRIV